VLSIFVSAMTAAAWGQTNQPTSSCDQCAEWNREQEPFRIYGNTYYVGPHGLSSILITSPEGHVLLDGALSESVPQIGARIRSLGFRIEDVKLIVNSHVHYDHAGGIAGLQRLSGAKVAASPWSAAVMTKYGVSPVDPQLGLIRPIDRIDRVSTLHDGQVFRVGNIALTAHLTPGHTQGGTSWTWQSCQDGRCLNLVYADSVTPVSSEGFRFSDSPKYPNAVNDFEKSLAFLRATPCDILLTTHPDASGLWNRVDDRRRGVQPDPMVDTNACKDLAARSAEQLRRRLSAEAKKSQK
jgi:metallo-beta-lactamase class B